MAVYLTQKELAELVGRTDRQIRNINGIADPDEKLLVKAENGKYDACVFVQRWCEMQVKKMTDGADDLDAVKARHEIVKTEKTQLEVARMRGELLDYRDVRKAWGDIANSVMNALLNIPGQVAPMIRGMESVEMISGILDGEIRRALENIADSPIPSYANEDAQEEEETEE
jgi:phage terminase Nu1 subunit (DNA packaging protein)